MSEEIKEIQWTIHKTHPEIVKNARDRLSEVVDPEIGMTIIQLGLVRDIEIENNIAYYFLQAGAGTEHFLHGAPFLLKFRFLKII